MAEQDVLYSKEDGIAVITLNRPEKLNAVTHEMVDKLIPAIIEEIKRDEAVRVVILTGSGRGFCAGTDISGDVPSAKEEAIARAKRKSSTYDLGAFWFFNSIPKPTICAINGAAVGIGAEFTLHCDIRIAAEGARWGQVFVLRGMVPDTGAGTYLLPRIVGLPKACELVFSGEIIDAPEMLRLGLVSQVVPNEELMPTAMELARKLKKGAPLAVQMAKQLMYKGLDRTVEAHTQATAACLNLTFLTDDFTEGIKSFLEKREPSWTGR